MTWRRRASLRFFVSGLESEVMCRSVICAMENMRSPFAAAIAQLLLRVSAATPFFDLYFTRGRNGLNHNNSVMAHKCRPPRSNLAHERESKEFILITYGRRFHLGGPHL